jgi:hypothetical protein
MSDEEVSKVLENLIELDDIHACMLARIDKMHIIPKHEHFETEVKQILDDSTRAVEGIFKMVKQYGSYNVPWFKIKLKNYYVLYYILPDKQNILTSIIPISTNNLESLNIKLENTCREIQKILEQ